MELTDTILLERWTRQRNSDAFAELVARHAGMVYATSLRILKNPADAEEITQDCFLKLTQSERTYNSVAGWLYRVATNRSIDRLRKRDRESFHASPVEEPAAPVSDAAWAEIESLLDEAVADLPENLRVPVVLHYFEGRTHEAIADELGLSRSAVTRRIQRANDDLRDRLKGKGIAATAAALAAGLGGLTAAAAPPALIVSLSKRALASDVGAAAPATTAWGIGTGKLAAVVTALLVATAAAIVAYLQPETTATTAAQTVASAPPEPIAAAPSAPSATGPVVLAQADSSGSAVDAASADATVMLHCVDENKNPIPGAEVYFLTIRRTAMPMSPRIDPDAIHIAKSGPHLANEAGDVPLPSLEISGDESVFVSAFARIPGERSGCWNAFPGRAEVEPVLTLVPSRTVSGTVTVPDGFSPRDVHVDLLTLRQAKPGELMGGSFTFTLNEIASSDAEEVPFPQFSRFTPDADGNFALTDVPQTAAIYLAANGPGLGEAQYFTFDLAGVEHVPIPMVAEGRIEGTIVNADTGRPAAAADYAVYARIQSGGGTVGVTHSRYGVIRPDGTYTIPGLAEGVYSVALAPPAMPRTDTAAVLIRQTVVAGTAVTGADIRLEEGVLAKGRVEAADSGQGIAGVLVVGLSPGSNDGMVVDTVRTDANGDYALRLPSGTSKLYIADIGTRDYMPPKNQGSREFDVAGNERSVDVDPIVLEAANVDDPMQATDEKATVTGRVVDTDGNPVAAAVLSEDWEFKEGDDSLQWGLTNVGTTRDDGTFEIQVKAGGKHTIGAGKVGYTRVTSETFQVRPGDTKSLPDFVIEPVNAWVSGTVVDPDGNPMGGVHVQVSTEHGYTPPHQVTGPDGAFYFTGLPDEAVSVSLAHPLHETTPKIVAPNEDHTIALTPLEVDQ